MAETFRYRIYTPEKIFQDDVTESLVLQGLDGQLCVQAHHMPALFALDTGLIRVKKEEEDAEKAAEELTRLKARERRSVREHKRNAITLARTIAELSRRDRKNKSPNL